VAHSREVLKAVCKEAGTEASNQSTASSATSPSRHRSQVGHRAKMRSPSPSSPTELVYNCSEARRYITLGRPARSRCILAGQHADCAELEVTPIPAPHSHPRITLAQARGSGIRMVQALAEQLRRRNGEHYRPAPVKVITRVKFRV
jgi:hypothetical protein